MLTRKATQATITQTCIFLHVLQLLHFQTQLKETKAYNSKPVTRGCSLSVTVFESSNFTVKSGLK